MNNDCDNCKWAFPAWAQTAPDKFPTNHLRCWPGGNQEQEQAAAIPCLKWQLDDGGSHEV